MQPGRHNAHITLLGFLVTLAMCVFLTDVVKNAVGRPRPDLISRCKPAKGTPERALVTIDVCTQPDQHILHEGWRSFPSGHSSFAFAGLGFLALYVVEQFHLFSGKATPILFSKIMIADRSMCLLHSFSLLKVSLPDRCTYFDQERTSRELLPF